MIRQTSAGDIKDHGDRSSHRNNNLVKDDSSDDYHEKRDESVDKHNDELIDVKPKKQEYENTADFVPKSPGHKRLKTLIKQKTFLNAIMGAKAFKDILSSNSNKAPEFKSFQAKSAKFAWQFCIFEMSKKKYHLFDNKLKADYNNIPINPDDETLMV